MVGVTHPGQVRYINYFETILRGGSKNFEFQPRCRKLISIVFHGIPNFNSNSCRPQVDIYNVRDDKKISSEKFEDLRKIMANSDIKGEICELDYRGKDVRLYGDTFIKFKHLGTFTSSKMFRLAFNSNFEKNKEIVFNRYMVDPDTVAKDFNTFPDSFSVRLILEDMSPELVDLAGREELKEQQKGADTIIKILEKREAENLTVLDTQNLVFGDPDFDDRDEMMVVNMEAAGQIPSDDPDD